MSKLERVIDEIEDYIDSCKFQTLSKTSIIVDKRFLDAKLGELRNLIPNEIKKYQTIINNKDAILDDAREKAHTLIDDAQKRRNELIDNSEVMQQAYQQANDVIKAAADQAQKLLDDAQTESNGMRQAAVAYTDTLLENVENTLQASINATNSNLKSLLIDYESYLETVKKNRIALGASDVISTVESEEEIEIKEDSHEASEKENEYTDKASLKTEDKELKLEVKPLKTTDEDDFDDMFDEMD